MRSLFGFTLATVTTLLLGYFTYVHLRHSAESSDLQADTASREAAEFAQRARKETEETYNAPRDDQDSVTVAGPLVNFMKGISKVETVEAAYRATESDRVGDSVVGTTNKVLHQTFLVAGAVDVPFDVPAHAYSPQLRGTFRSFIQASGAPTTAPGDVEFLLLSDAQYSALLHGQPGDAVFSADATHDQEVNANLPPTLNQPVKYHLMFRNVSPKTGKRVVQAEFEMNF
jgi:hypothetical protein